MLASLDPRRNLLLDKKITGKLQNQ